MYISQGVFLKNHDFHAYKKEREVRKKRKRKSPEIGAFNSPQFKFKWYIFKAITIFLFFFSLPPSGTLPSMNFFNVDDDWCSLRESVFSRKMLQSNDLPDGPLTKHGGIKPPQTFGA